VLEFLARAIRQEKEIKGIQMGNEVVILFLLEDDMTLYLKTIKPPPENLVLTSTFSRSRIQVKHKNP
jgi:hypothetical protein